MMPLARPVTRCETLVELTSLILHVTLYTIVFWGPLCGAQVINSIMFDDCVADLDPLLCLGRENV